MSYCFMIVSLTWSYSIFTFLVRLLRDYQDNTCPVYAFSSLYLTNILQSRKDSNMSVPTGIIKKVDLFRKKFLFFPYNHANHWSLFVVVNPFVQKFGVPEANSEDVREENKPLFCILHFDSMPSIHVSKKVAKCIKSWLKHRYLDGEGSSSTSIAWLKPKLYIPKGMHLLVSDSCIFG